MTHPDSMTNRWQYVQRNNVQLPDEYDQIYHDLEPFWGVDPLDLQAVQTEMEQKQWSYTVGKVENGPLDIIHDVLPKERRAELMKRARDVVDLLKDVQHFIPPFRAVFSPWDNPSLLSDYQTRTEAMEAASIRSCASPLHSICSMFLIADLSYSHRNPRSPRA